MEDLESSKQAKMETTQCSGGEVRLLRKHGIGN